MIELILVMAILTIALSLTAPALANFFRGRTLDSEARRLLALTREGQARAISQGVPTELWLDADKGSIGLETEASYEPVDPRAVEVTLGGDIRLSVENPGPKPGDSPAQTTFSSPTTVTRPKLSRHPNLPRIRFLPDGSIDEQSPQIVRLTGSDDSSLILAQTTNHSAYEIRTRTD